MFKTIDIFVKKYFRGITPQTSTEWQQLQENDKDYVDNKSASIKGDIFRNFGDKWIKHIDCDDGWLDLIADCHSELLAIDPNYTVFQIKQKFGTLRYYAEPSKEKFAKKFRTVINNYEQLSAQTCESTGTKGVLMKKGGWYKTLDPTLGSVLGYEEMNKK